MNRILFVFLTFAISAVVAFGQSKSQAAAPATKTDTVKVATVQCGSCKMAIEKALKGLDGVKSANVDLKKKVVTVEYVASKLDLDKIEIAITKAGYAANDRTADPEAYEKLDLGKIETAITKAGYAANDKKADPAAYEKLDDCCKLPEDQE